MKGKFILRKDKGPNQYGEYCVYIQYSTMGVPVRKSLDIWVKPEHWSGDDGRTDRYVITGRNGHPQGGMLNSRLLNIRRSYDRTIEELLEEQPGSVMTVPMLRSILNGSFKERQEIENGKIPFVDYALEVNQDLYRNRKISYSVWYNIQCQMNMFTKYLRHVRMKNLDGDSVLYCKDLTVDVISGYIDWRRENGNTNDTINKSLTPIFKTVRKIARQGWIDRNTGEEILELYLPTNIKSLEDNKEDRHYLTEEQVRQLIKVTERSKYPRTKELVDMFLFSIHAGGMRFSDVCTLRWSEVDMVNRAIRHLQMKNHTRKPTVLNLPVTEEGMKILEKWEGKNDNFVFGMLPDDFNLDDEECLKLSLNSQNKTMNQSLRCLGEKMGLPFRLHFHCARHTFGTLGLNKGVDLNVISHLMGHSSTWVTQKVYSKYLPETLSREVNEKLNFNFG